jgi:hypothetical protein
MQNGGIMADETTLPDIDIRHNTLVRWGVAGTVAYLGLIAIYAVCRFSEILTLKPNEVGDMLAGIFAPLALGWLVLGFFQQGQELQASTAALQLQADELRNSVAQQQELVSVSRQQLEDERARSEALERAADQSAQPRFVIGKFEKMSLRQDEVWTSTFTFPIKNAGGVVVDVEFIQGNQTPPAKFPVWATNEVKNFTFILSDITSDIEILVNFTDMRGKSGFREFMLFRREKALWLASVP